MTYGVIIEAAKKLNGRKLQMRAFKQEVCNIGAACFGIGLIQRLSVVAGLPGPDSSLRGVE
jgi:hypothetical protein